jgi:exopolyphosphatase/guanosine-5'-triphosphate,3'-diphosphate pyrophosphatase
MTNSSAPVAAIDLGTNTCLLLIARSYGTDLRAVAQELTVVRLGEGVDETGKLASAAMDRAVECLRRYGKIVEQHGCKKVRGVGTSAFREAVNRDEFAQRIEAETGLAIETIDGKEEARLVQVAVEATLPSTGGIRAIVDIGGGSTEITITAGGQQLDSVSLPIGSVRLTERFLKHDPPTADELTRLHIGISETLAGLDLQGPTRTMISVGGTATTLVAMHNSIDPYDPDKVHGSKLSLPQIMEQIKHCARVPLAERIKIAGLHPGRAEVIIAGGMIQTALMEYFDLGELIVSDHGLRWGIAAELVADSDAGIK